MIRLKKLLQSGLLLLIALLPFHTLFTVWAATNWGHLYIWSAWKEVFVGALGLGAGGCMIFDETLRRRLWARLYNRLAGLYVILCVVYVLAQQLRVAPLVGFAINVRFLIIFLVAQVAAYYLIESKDKIVKLLMITSSFVALFALLQITILPSDFLTHFGYDPASVNTPGIPPASHVVAAGSDWYRAQSTLRGPNVLGASMLLPIVVAAYLYIKKRKAVWLGLVALLTAALLASYSRSAAMGLLVGAAVWIAHANTPFLQRFIKRYLWALVLAMLLVVTVSSIVWRTATFQSVILHNNPEVAAVQSNEGHLTLAVQAARSVAQDPLGNGLGSAGPGSALANASSARIAENYFLQVGQELGWLGLVLFLSLQVVVLLALGQRSDKPYVLPVLAAMAGLAFTNLLLHTWSDEVVSIVAWCFAGLMLAPEKATKKPS